MFKKYPYNGWLIIVIIMWCVTGYRFFDKSRSITPQKMAKVVERDLHNREKKLDQLLENRDLIQRIFTNNLSQEEVETVSSLPFGFYTYKDGIINFWNSNKVLADCNDINPNKKEALFQNERGVFIKKCLKPDYLKQDQELVVLLPLVTIYPFENNYLYSHFEAADYIPLSTKLHSRNVKNSYPITTQDEQLTFYLSFTATEQPVWTPDSTMLWMLFASLLVTIIWFQLITVSLIKTKSFLQGWGLTVGIIVGLRLLSYFFGLPFHLKSLQLFSSQLYASSSVHPSLGDLLINALCFLWIMVYTVRYMPEDVLERLRLNGVIKGILAVVLSFVLVAYAFWFINIISSLVIDSSISFDVSHFYTITWYTIVGLFTVGIITIASCLVVYIIHKQLSILVENKWLKYVVVLVVGLAAILWTNYFGFEDLAYIVLAWLVIFLLLLDVKRLQWTPNLFASRMIFWVAFICIFCTGTLQYFNYVKEHNTRKRFAEEIVQQRDDVTEYTFRNIAASIQRDPNVLAFFEEPTIEKRKAINERFEALYLGGQLNKYQSKIFLYDTTGKPLFNTDTIKLSSLERQVSTALPTLSLNLFHKEYAEDGHYYLARIPIEDRDDTITTKLGYVFVDMAVKEATGETVYPELLQPGTVKGNRNEEGYSYGVYINDRLITQTSDYNFPVFLREDQQDAFHFYEWEGSSELRYKADETKTVIVIRYHKLWLESITLFSYLFGIQLLIALISTLYRGYFIYVADKEVKQKFLNFTLRRRIHLSMLGLVFVSFIIIGLVTILFFTLQYQQSNKRKQQLVMQLVERAALQYIKDQKALNSVEQFNKLATTPRFRYFITSLANSQNIDINFYYASGVLGVTSQENIYDKSLFARIMQPDAYYRLYSDNRQLVIQDEHIGRLSYISCYIPLKNENGVTLGYVNVPFFSSLKELNFQISNIVVVLINLYAFIFLISGVLTVFITGWITRSFNIVISRFEKFSLSKNELIDWPYDDEVGLLVGEYNKMVKKVEENAKLLAQSEREGAWREMARQVAHEIKNPLTPMKLNIQYLQQALRNNYPNVTELAKKVSESLIEQIDNLSYIASEFSSFAKMPEAKPEQLDLNEMLQKTVDLYKNQDEIHVTLQKSKEPLIVYTDKSQLLRVFNNLLENAVQAIPDEREGLIQVQLQKDNGYAVISFVDNGSGIDEETVDKIFQPYFTTKSSGTGLGLAMTKKIIEFWKGKIWFETTLGEGTTFYISIPTIKNS